MARQISTISGNEVVFGGVSDYEIKEITFKINIELPEERRKEYLIQFFNLEDKFVEDELLATNLLKTITITYVARVPGKKIPSGSDHNTMSVAGLDFSNTRGEAVPILFRHQADQIAYSPIMSQSKKLTGVTLLNVDEQLRSTYLHGSINGGWEKERFASTSFQFAFLRDFRASLKFLDSVRQSTKKVETRFVDDLTKSGYSGGHLVNLIETVYMNNLDRFNEIAGLCMRLFPDITRIHPERLPDNHIRVTIRKRNIPYDIDLAQEGMGIDQLFIIVWAIASSPPETIWFLDEPELHLHPGAQKLLHDFLKEESGRGKQMFVATHSMVFIHSSGLDEVSLLLDNRGHTELASLQDIIEAEKENLQVGFDEARKHIYESLGYDPMFAFEPKVVIMVEGMADEKILRNFAKTLGRPINPRSVRFLVVGDKRKIEKFSPIFANGISGKRCLIVLDNDKESPDIIEKKILDMEREYRKTLKLNQPLLNELNFHLYPEHVYSIEYYLLEAEAICKAGGSDDYTLIKNIRGEIQAAIEPLHRKQLLPKQLMQHLWSDVGNFGEYSDVNTAARISEHISKKHLDQYPEIVSLVSSVA